MGFSPSTLASNPPGPDLGEPAMLAEEALVQLYINFGQMKNFSFRWLPTVSWKVEKRLISTSKSTMNISEKNETKTMHRITFRALNSVNGKEFHLLLWQQWRFKNGRKIIFNPIYFTNDFGDPQFSPPRLNFSLSLKTLRRPQCNMAVYCFSAPPQVTNTFPEVAFKFSGLFGLPTCLFVRLSLPDIFV